MTTTNQRTRRSPDGHSATGGAVRQDGPLPIYICNACGNDVVWATSTKTGRKYLANVYRGYLNQRYYVKRSAHQCPAEVTL